MKKKSSTITPSTVLVSIIGLSHQATEFIEQNKLSYPISKILTSFNLPRNSFPFALQRLCFLIKKMDFCNNFNGFSDNCFGFQEVSNEGLLLVLDGKRGERVKPLVKPGRKVTGAEKALLALRNHSEAERRRRERINAHLTTLRGLIPGTAKMDKAALLAEVVNQVKELRGHVTEVTRGTLVPTDIDELIVEQEDQDDENSFSIRASLCCDFKTELLSDIREAIEALPLKTVRAEIATLGSRMINVFVIAGCNADVEGSQLLVDSVRKALRSVLDKFYASEEFSSRNTMSDKRRRLSLFSSSNSSSHGDIW